MDWSEELPEMCPPTDAFDPSGRIFYRLCGTPICDDDFKSHRFLNPEKIFNTTECICHSLSISDSETGLKNLLKMPLHKGKHIVELTLKTQDGLILKTGRTKGHYSWWRTKQFQLNTIKIAQ